ncbi:MAG: hypothetical protein SGI88_05230 [Candidatus Hydrogenedentes bacterium]|nr:hypothetical protein [Candidatus Hydrogenedentota bacterium]
MHTQIEKYKILISDRFVPCFIAYLVGVCVRGCMLGGGERMPGVNGAYSPVQVRSLLEKGALGLPDYPCMFAIHAGLAATIHKVTGLALEPSIVLAVKLCIAMLPPLAAIPVFLLCRTWCVRVGCQRSRLPFVAAAMASVGAPFMLMTGNFDKNALALVWLAALLLALHTYMERRSVASLAATTLFLVLLGLTHIGTFTTGLLLWVCVISVYIMQPSGPPLRVTIPTIAVSILAVALAEGYVFWKFDPARIGRLLGAMANPFSFALRQSASTRPMEFTLLGVFLLVAHLGALGGLAGIVFRTVHRNRSRLSNADIALVCGSVIAIVLITGPWIRNDASPRLIFIAALPAIVVAVFTVIHSEPSRTRRVLVAVGIPIMIVPGLLQGVIGGWRIVSDEAYAELKASSVHIPHPERTLVVAMHGMEWDVAWVLRTHVAQASAVRASDWQKYDQVLFLATKEHPEPLGRIAPVLGLSSVSAAENERKFLILGPFAKLSFVEIPAGAETVHDGEYLKLGRVETPPPFVVDKP